ncbi:hypothetical protein RMCBS344292_10973 [Rhizopus microsporus]|nr:hypothetical protein RMCBS344292_10973 [Rhizopus microsporus]
MVSTAILHPLDLIKIRFQEPMQTIEPHFKVNRYSNQRMLGGTVKAFREILVEEGFWRGLYRGITPNMAGSTLSWGMYFGWYSLIKKYMKKDSQGKLSPVQHLTASAEAGKSEQTDNR